MGHGIKAPDFHNHKPRKLMSHQKNGVKIDPTDPPVTPKAQMKCPLFTAIPVEIRHMVYRQVLTIPETIKNVHKHIGSKDTALVNNYQPIPHIDAAFLRTCRLIYSEALPILYGYNTFEFSSSNAIRSFQSKSLIGYPPGRPFSLLRSLIALLVSAARSEEYRAATLAGLSTCADEVVTSFQFQARSYGSINHGPICCAEPERGIPLGSYWVRDERAAKSPKP